MHKETYQVPALFILLVLSFGLLIPQFAWATVEEADQTPPTQEEIDRAIADGSIFYEKDTENEDSSEFDEANSMSPAPMAFSAASSASIQSRVHTEQFAGATMFETAIEEAKASYPSGTDSALIVGDGIAWIDALSSSSLMPSKGPILFTYKNALHPATKTALKDLGIKHVIIIGGTAAISTNVEREIESLGIQVETRLAGSDCYGTQLEIFKYGVEQKCFDKDYVMVATGCHFADALSGAPIAAAKHAPVFLVDSSGRLNSTQMRVLKEAASQGYCKQPVILGGTAVVSDYAYGQIEAVSDIAGGSGKVIVLAGAHQYETSEKIAKWAVEDCGFTWNNLAYTTGKLPYDALAGAGLQAKDNSVLLLVDNYDDVTITGITPYKSDIHQIRFFGGKAGVKPDVRMSIADEFGFPYAALPNFKVFVDAGHGFEDVYPGVFDPGACANGYQEHDLACELANMVANTLKNTYGVETYVNDHGGPYKFRHAKAQVLDCDAILSIHFNAGGGTGSAALYHNRYAAHCSYAWAQQIEPALPETLGLRDLGLISQDVCILNGELPATLLEICFIDNNNDMNVYQSNKYDLARNIAKKVVA